MIGQRLTIDRQLGARIKSARLELNLSQAALGALLGIPVDQVSRLENGDTHISSDHLTEIAAALGQTVSFFFQGWAARPTAEHLFIKAGEHEVRTVGLLASVSSGETQRTPSGGSFRRVGPVNRDYDQELSDLDIRYRQ